VNSVSELPVGTVTFLFTDIEGSTQLLKQLRDQYGIALEDQQRILRESFANHGGHEIDTQGDSFFVAFRRAKDGVSAAVECQRRLAEHAWPDGTEVRVRMGIHTGEPAVGGERYVGLGVHRAARICSAGHGGQVLVSQTTRELLRDDPVSDVSLRDLGEHQLKDMDEPERLYQLVAPGLRDDFPDLKTASPPPFEGREDELAEAAAEELARPWRRPGRRVLIGATFTAALVGVAAGVILTQGGDSTAVASVSPNAVGVVDSGSGRIVSEVPVGSSPTHVAATDDAVWVTNVNDKTVSRIDPETDQVVQTIQVGGGPAGVAVGGGAVWVANGLDGTVSRIDPRTNLEVQKIRVGNGPSDVAYGQGAVWVTNSADGTVSRIDPASGRPPRTFPAAVGASGIAVAFGKVWVASPPSATVVVLDPGSGRVLKPIPVGGEPGAVAAGEDALWVANRADATVSNIDPSTASVRDVVTVGRGPVGIAAEGDAIWVANGTDATLVRLDPTNGEILKSVSLVNPPRGLALGPSGVYVAVQSTGAENRGGTLRVQVPFSVDSVDPAFAYSTWSLLPLAYDGLVGFKRVGGIEGTQLVPNLAVALPTPSEGGKTYAFEVRRGIRYSNGKAVQPEDFRRAIERLFVIGSGGAPYYSGITGADRCRKGKSCDLTEGIVTDRATRTVTFRLTAPDADFLAKLALPFAVAVPAGTPSKTVGARPLPASGPYRIAALDLRAKRLTLERNRLFRAWSPDARPQAYPDTISVSWRLDLTASVKAVERGAADVVTGGGPPVPKEELDRLAVRYPTRVHLNTQLSTFYFFLNTRVPPFDDLQVRRAVNLAFDGEAFTRQLGSQFVPTCQILPPNSPAYRPVCPYSPGGVTSLDRARQLVRRSGAAGDRVTVWMPGPIAEQGRYLVSVLNSLGLRSRLKVQPRQAHFDSVHDPATRAQAGFYAWAIDFPSAAGFIPPAFGCEAFSNVSRLCVRSIDAKMKAATATQVQDPAAATSLWQEVERALLAQAPIVPMYNRNDIGFVSERVGNYQYNPQWGVLLDQLWVR
jgi:YVTN family beta-propeller protein